VEGGNRGEKGRKEVIENLLDATTFDVSKKLISLLTEEEARGIRILPSLGQAFFFCHCMEWVITAKTIGNLYRVSVEWYHPGLILHEVSVYDDNPTQAAWLAIILALEKGAKHV